MSDDKKKPGDGLDLEALERDWRSGLLSNREIAAKYGMSEGNVRAYARRYGWQKEPAIKAGVKAMVVGKVRAEPKPKPERAQASMEGVVESLAEIAIEVVQSHRFDIKRMRATVRAMALEMQDSMDNLPILEERIVEYFSEKAQGDPLQAGIYRQQMQQALYTLGLGSRSKTMLNLVNAMDKLIAMERTSFGLDEVAPEQSYEDNVKELHRQAMEKRNAGENRIN